MAYNPDCPLLFKSAEFSRFSLILQRQRFFRSFKRPFWLKTANRKLQIVSRKKVHHEAHPAFHPARHCPRRHRICSPKHVCIISLPLCASSSLSLPTNNPYPSQTWIPPREATPLFRQTTRQPKQLPTPELPLQLFILRCGRELRLCHRSELLSKPHRQVSIFPYPRTETTTNPPNLLTKPPLFLLRRVPRSCNPAYCPHYDSLCSYSYCDANGNCASAIDQECLKEYEGK